jgi:hypothetical protein
VYSTTELLIKMASKDTAAQPVPASPIERSLVKPGPDVSGESPKVQKGEIT